MLLNEIKKNWSKEFPYNQVDVRNPDIPDNFVINFNDHKVYVSMSPFMWMRPETFDKGVAEMQFSLSLKKNAANIECEFIKWKAEYLKSSKAEVVKHAMKYLNKNGVVELEKMIKDWAKENESFNKAHAITKAKEAQQDVKAKKDGYRFKVLAVVHHERGGDDTSIGWYSEKKPTMAEIKAILKKEKSIEFDDYTIVEL